MKACVLVLVLSVAVVGWAAGLAAAGDGQGAERGKGPRLTEEQREQVREIVEAARTDIQALREQLRAEVKKLRELRQSGADEQQLAAQREAIKSKCQALRARWEKLRGDLKTMLPADVFARCQKRFRERRQEFLDNHPRLKEWRNRHRERQKHRGDADAKSAAEE